jgi:multiple sugar transport system permease protein
MRTRRLLRVLLLLPALALIVLVVVLPAIQAVVLALAGDAGFTLDPFRRVLSDADALRNTIVLLVLLLPVQGIIAVALALVLAARFRGAGVLLYLVVLPLAVSDLAAGLLWLAILTDRGYLNSALQDAGVIAQPIAWLGFDSYGGLLAAVIVAETWRTIGIVLLPILARLRADATEGRALRVSLPLLRSSLGPALVLRAILALQTFAVVFVLAGRNLPVLAGEAYTQLATNRDEHAAAVYVVVVLLLAVVGSVAYLRFLPARVPAER